MIATSLEVQYGFPLVILSPLVAVSKTTNLCHFSSKNLRKNDMDLSKTKLRIEMKGFGFMYNNNIKPIYNYDLQECNLLFKKGIHPIGCGVGNKDGRVYHVFMADKKYFNAVSLIKYEQMDKWLIVIFIYVKGRYLYEVIFKP